MVISVKSVQSDAVCRGAARHRYCEKMMTQVKTTSLAKVLKGWVKKHAKGDHETAASQRS